MNYVHISAKVANRIEALKKAGKAGAALAQKATRIIESLTSGIVKHPLDAIGSYTKNGENRIKNCRKYDLGCGYRLIILQRGFNVWISFLGTHDECQRWLENNSRLKEVTAGKGTLLRVSDKQLLSPSPTSGASEDTQENAADEVLLRLNDRGLRRIFCGLVGSDRKRLL